ncbi:MAG: hypothetical protein H6817_01380 [Phycisphaerales bacterium]|nr:hypothetical protein [Phycisphaerales bacterium]
MLQKPLITDRGIAAGFAYEAAESVPSAKADNGNCVETNSSILSVVMLDTAGDEIANYRYRQCVPDVLINMYPAPIPRPFVMQFLVDASESVAAFQISEWNDGCEQDSSGETPLSLPRTVWRFYSLITGRLLVSKEEEVLLGRSRDSCPEDFCGVIESIAVSGSPLFLMHALLPDNTNFEYGARFIVATNTGQRLWSLDALGDYEYMQPPNVSNGITPAHLFANEPAIALTHEPRQFCIRLRRERTEILFDITQSTEGNWNIDEVGRRPYLPQSP